MSLLVLAMGILKFLLCLKYFVVVCYFSREVCETTPGLEAVYALLRMAVPKQSSLWKKSLFKDLLGYRTSQTKDIQ